MITLVTPDGDPIIAWGSWGPVRGYGPLYRTIEGAGRNHRRDVEGCVRQGGYSDRIVVAVDKRGYCWRLDMWSDDERIGSWVRDSSGQAARYSDEDIAPYLEPDDDADCIAEMRAEHDADVRRMNGDE